jgi:hypothetical protein
MLRPEAVIPIESLERRSLMSTLNATLLAFNAILFPLIYCRKRKTNDPGRVMIDSRGAQDLCISIFHLTRHL